MNRKNLIELVVTVAATAALCGRAGADTPQSTQEKDHEAAGKLDITHAAWSECVQAAIPRLDHPESTSETIARAAMDSCSDRYADMMRALSRTLGSACSQDSDCTHNALAKAQQEATRAATDEVVAERIRVAGAQVLICE